MKHLVIASIMLVALSACKVESRRAIDTNIDEPVVPPPPPPPVEGTLLSSECGERGVELFTYADGNDGTYTEQDRESVECGYEAPYLTVEVGEAGDAFDPTVISVSTSQYDEPVDLSLDWEWESTESTLGNITRTENGLEILSFEGITGDGEVIIGGEAYQYSLREEPLCENTPSERQYGGKTDCMGNQVTSNSWEYIWFGDDDTRVVTVSVVWFKYTSQPIEAVDGSFILSGGTIGGTIYAAPVTGSKLDFIEGEIEKMNAKLAKSNIYIEFELVGTYYVNWTTVGGGRSIQNWMAEGKIPYADVVPQVGYSRPGTCGVAYASTRFGRGSNPRTFQTRCGYDTWLHELGHNVGMAHGPLNSGYPALGYIFPAFGHGTMDYCGRTRASIMSYGYGPKYFTNSTQTCLEQGAHPSRVNEDDMAGSKTVSDEAYHMNRIRYNLSLITERDGEFSNPEEMPLLQYDVEEEEQGELIID